MKLFSNQFTQSIIFAILLIILAGCAAEVVAVAPTPRPTRTPTPTATPRPTVTPTVTPASACSLPYLLMTEHIAASGSYTETETTAAGGMVCRIAPGSCAHSLMIGNLNPSIVFKNEEIPPYNEDILMHPAMLMPLYRLSQLVTEEWNGEVLLRITDAYDSMLEHDLGQPDKESRISLHFEGRSVDLTTWPTDTNKYARLCALAHCAGFDWVQNEGDHCHASIKADSLCLQCR